MNKPDLIKLPGNNGFEIITQEDIISISSEDKFLHFYLENEIKKTIRGSIKKTQEILTHPSLIRCHQRHIINLKKIKGVINNNTCAIMQNGKKIPVSRRYRSSFLKELNSICLEIKNN